MVVSNYTTSGTEKLYPSSTSPGAYVTLAPGQMVTYQWTNGVWANASSTNDSPTPPIILTGAAKLPNGAFQFAFPNTPAGTNTVLTTTNLLLPLTSWTVLGTVTDTSPGQFQFTDPQATNRPMRFYRVRSP